MIIIQGGAILTMDGDQRVIRNGSVVIEGEFIKAVLEPGESPPEDGRSMERRVIDASGQIVLPGLINMHSGLIDSGFRFSKETWGPKPVDKNKQRLRCVCPSKEGFLTGALAGIIEQIHAGVSTVYGLHAPRKDVGAEMAALAEAVSRTGIRACLAPALRDVPDSGKSAAWLKQAESFLRWSQRERRPTLHGMVGLHRSSSCSDDLLGAAADLSARMKSGIHIEVAPTREDAQECVTHHGLRVVQRLHDQDLLHRDTIAAHVVHVDENELEILRNSECLVAHTPSADLLRGRNSAPVAGIVKRGIRLGVGSADQPAGPLAEARLCRIVQSAWSSEKQRPPLSPLDKLLFSDSSKFAGASFGFRMGSLEPGALADVATFPALITRPESDWEWADQVLLGVGAQTRAKCLIVGGNLVMKDGVVCALCEEEVAAKAREEVFSDPDGA